MKSVLGSKRPANLIRDIVIHDIDEEDGRIAYQAYRLNQLPNNWKVKQGIKPKDFITELDNLIALNYTHAWSVRDQNPICMVFGLEFGGFIHIGDVIWNPKATPRQKLEAGAKFFQDIPETVVTSSLRDKHFYEKLMNYGFLRRVGSVYKKGKRYALFQTRV